MYNVTRLLPYLLFLKALSEWRCLGVIFESGNAMCGDENFKGMFHMSTYDIGVFFSRRSINQ